MLSIQSRHNIGHHYEQQALVYLNQQGLTLRARNYRCKVGEIDLIMHDQNQLVFVEVRYRRSVHYGGARASINASKQKKIRLTAHHFMLKNHINCHDQWFRFDVVAFDNNQISWIRSAF